MLMKRFIFSLMFCLVLGSGQSFAFDDVGDQQTVVTEQTEQFADLSFEELVFAAVEVQKDTGQPQDAIYTHYSHIETRGDQQLKPTYRIPAIVYEKRQAFFAEVKLPPNYRLAYS